MQLHEEWEFESRKNSLVLARKKNRQTEIDRISRKGT
jgi:hypothetical protein